MSETVVASSNSDLPITVVVKLIVLDVHRDVVLERTDLDAFTVQVDLEVLVATGDVIHPLDQLLIVAVIKLGVEVSVVRSVGDLGEALSTVRDLGIRTFSHVLCPSLLERLFSI